MDPLSVTASIIAVLQLTSTVINYLINAKDASKDQARCATEASNIYHLLTNLKYRLEEAKSENASWHTAVRSLAVANGPLDQYKSALDQLQSKVATASTSRLHKAGRALVWKSTKDEVANILSRIERLKSLIQIALEMDHSKLSQAIRDDTTSIKTAIPVLTAEVKCMRESQDNQRHRVITDWLSSTDFPAQQSDFTSRRQEGTGLWFINSPEFTSWLQGTKQTLFCPGIPGAGKTIIASIAVDYLWKTFQKDNIGIASVYCNYKARETQTTTDLVAAILKQLVQERPLFGGPVAALHERHADRRTRPSLDELLTALNSVGSCYYKVYIVLDGLDECSDSDGTCSKLLAKLRSSQTKTDISLMATSRFMPKVVQFFEGFPMLEIRASDADVKQFVAGQMNRLPHCVHRNTSLQGEIQDRIVQAVDGMFLLACLHLDSLRGKPTKKAVQSALAKLPKGSEALKEAYDEAIQRIKGQLPEEFELAKNVLSWITCAQRALTTEELSYALAVEADELELDEDNIPDIEDMVSVCAGLVTVDEESNIVRLVHYTTQEYFERIREDWNPRAQQEIASACLTYLSFKTFRAGSCPSNEDFEHRLTRNPFLDYAARHWGQHALTVQKTIKMVALPFLYDETLVSCSTQVTWVLQYKADDYSQNFPRHVTGMHLAASFGLVCLLQDLINGDGNGHRLHIDMQDSYGQTPLLRATENGHESAVELLLSKGADVNAQTRVYSTRVYGSALQAATHKGHDKIVELLLSKGADVNAQDRYHGNALQAASRKGHDKIVELLLSKGADVNAQGGVLQEASLRGHDKIVKLLLSKGADVNAQGGSALQAASLRGHDKVIELLLSKGADVNAQGGDYGSALQAASLGGHDKIVELLLSKDADVNAQGRGFGSALWAASHGGHDKIVELLLSKGADVNAQGGRYGNALQAASSEGHDKIVKLLLSKGADVNAQGGGFGSALLAALHGGHDKIVELLLSKGADVNAQGGGFGSALWAASHRGYNKIVKLLLSKGADVNAQGGYYGSKLRAISLGGHHKIVKLLLSKGANANAQSGGFSSALQAALLGSHYKIAELLLSKGADVNAQGGDYGSALQAASYRGHDKTIELLLSKGADVNAQGGYYGSALQAASLGGHDKIVELLLSKGANVNVQGGHYGSALQAASLGGHDKTIELLLSKGADVNAQGGHYGSALQAVSYGGHDKTIELLLSKGADVNAQGGGYGSALQAASCRAHDKIIKLLLSKGAV